MKDLVSIIIPAHNEAESIPDLFNEISGTMATLKNPYEIIVVDDGSTDKTRSICTKTRDIKCIRHPSRQGKGEALTSGFLHAKGEIFVTLDADGQNDPSDIPKLLAKCEQGFDLVLGYRKKRFDSLLKLYQSVGFNFLVRFLYKTPWRDHNTGLKVIRRQWALNLPLGEGQFRLMTPMIHNLGGKISEIEVKHRPRIHGQSHFGLNRIYDLAILIYRRIHA